MKEIQKLRKNFIYYYQIILISLLLKHVIEIMIFHKFSTSKLN